MIISHKYKYLFIETPQTGCTAIRNELIKNYDGLAILKKHSLYSTFLKNATEEEKQYFVFSAIRNPLDKYVSTYLKIKNNHNQRYSTRLNFRGINIIYEVRNYFRYLKVKRPKYNYLNFLRENRWIPYDDISTLDHKKFDYIIRYENLNKDFSNVIAKIGAKYFGELPVVNKTKKKYDYIDFYKDYKATKYAKPKFKIFLKYWGYKFPESWGKVKISRIDIIIWNIIHFLRLISWKYVRAKKTNVKDYIK